MPGLIAIAQVLAFLGTVGATLLAAGAVIVFMLWRQAQWARLAAIAGVGVLGIYAAALFALSAVSPSTLIASGQRKVFCEIDCHVAFDIVSPVERDGDTVRLTLREEFRRNSIGPRRGDAALTPGERRIALIDENGHRYLPDRSHALQSAPLFAPMRPGEEHRAELRFAVPANVTLRGLLVETRDPIARVLLGHERSPFHAKALLDVHGSLAGTTAAALD